MALTAAVDVTERTPELPEDTHTVELLFTDNHGVLRGKSVPAKQWARVANEGIAVSSAALIWGVRCELRDTSPAGGMAEGFPDVQLVPLFDTLRPVPWRSGVVQFMCEIETMAGEASPLSARNALKAVLDRSTALGYEVKAATEMEFYLLDPATKRPLGTEVNCYGIADSSGYSKAITNIQRSLDDYGIPIEACNYEYAPGQFEINLRYENAMEACDHAVLLRGAVKELALDHGLLATFMGKPFGELSGSGMHVHQSLWRDGVNMFADGQHQRLTQLGYHYLGGLQRRIRELTLFGSPTLNDYKRRKDNSFCPTRETWGYDNRTVALRVITAGNSVRIEQRDASADCNPYLLLAGQVAAGLEGIELGIDPPEACSGDSYTDTNTRSLPTTVLQAIDLLEASDFARTALPALLVDTHIDTSRWEYNLLTDDVSQLERDRYIGVL